MECFWEEETFEFSIEQRVTVLHEYEVCVSRNAFVGEVGNEREDTLGNRKGMVKDKREGTNVQNV